MQKQILKLSLISTAILALSGCAAIGTAIKHRNLNTQTKMSQAVFLPPVGNREKTVFVQVHNTTDKNDFNMQPQLVADLRAKGYRIKQDPDKAHYLLQVAVLNVGRTSKTAAEEMMHTGYGGALEGAAAGAASTAAFGSSHILAGGIAGSVAGTIADNLVTDVNYAGIVDVKITAHADENHHRKVFKTRIITSADKVNLSFDDAKPKLEHDIAHSIAGIF